MRKKKWLEGVDYMRKFHLTDTEIEINRYLSEGKKVLAEGAQGSLLDIDHGTYPFVSSSSTTSGGVCTGLGVAPNKLDHIFGIFKAYSTRVGSGPFPVELFDETGDTIRHIGNEYGAVTGRNRRCGWLDLVALKYAIMINSVTDLIMMKGDVLDSFKKIYVCTAYRKNGEITTEMPYDTEGWEAVYEELPGWNTPLTALRSEEELPQLFKDYIEYIEKATGTPITMVSVGPDRDTNHHAQEIKSVSDSHSDGFQTVSSRQAGRDVENRLLRCLPDVTRQGAFHLWQEKKMTHIP